MVPKGEVRAHLLSWGVEESVTRGWRRVQLGRVGRQGKNGGWGGVCQRKGKMEYLQSEGRTARRQMRERRVGGRGEVCTAERWRGAGQGSRGRTHPTWRENYLKYYKVQQG